MQHTTPTHNILHQKLLEGNISTTIAHELDHDHEAYSCFHSYTYLETGVIGAAGAMEKLRCVYLCYRLLCERRAFLELRDYVRGLVWAGGREVW